MELTSTSRSVSASYGDGFGYHDKKHSSNDGAWQATADGANIANASKATMDTTVEASDNQLTISGTGSSLAKRLLDAGSGLWNAATSVMVVEFTVGSGGKYNISTASLSADGQGTSANFKLCTAGGDTIAAGSVGSGALAPGDYEFSIQCYVGFAVFDKTTSESSWNIALDVTDDG